VREIRNNKRHVHRAFSRERQHFAVHSLGSRNAVLKAFSLYAAILLAACNPAAIRDHDLRAAARAAAQSRFAAQCGTVTVPDRALLPIDIAGDGHDSYVLSFARVDCEATPSLWSTAGKTLFQVWTNVDGKPHLVLEAPMAGFRHDYKSPMLITDQRGSSCPASTNSDICRVVYRWDATRRMLVIVERQAMPLEPLPVSGIMASGARSRASTASRRD
jgi:hypothetical protein